MKTFASILSLALLITMASCSNKNDDSVNPSDSQSKSEKVSGNWVVTYYFDSGKDETYEFSGYEFIFETDGTLKASSGRAAYVGSWWIGSKSGDDDSSSNELNMQITGNYQMDEVTDDWDIIKLTETEIWLQDDSKSGTSIEELHFTRKNQ